MKHNFLFLKQVLIYIVIEMTLKTDVLFVAANYDWLLPESKGHASGYITDLVAFLQSTFMSFTNLPVSCQLFLKGTKIHILLFNFSLDYQNSYKQTYAESFLWFVQSIAKCMLTGIPVFVRISFYCNLK